MYLVVLMFMVLLSAYCMFMYRRCLWESVLDFRLPETGPTLLGEVYCDAPV